MTHKQNQVILIFIEREGFLMFKKVVLIARILFGLMFVMAGTDGLLRAVTGNGLFPMPELSPAMATITAGFVTMKYLLPLVKILEIIAGLLFVSGYYLNLAIILITPIMVNILGINLFVEPSGAPMAIGLSLFLGLVIWDRWPHFKALISVKK